MEHCRQVRDVRARGGGQLRGYALSLIGEVTVPGEGAEGGRWAGFVGGKLTSTAGGPRRLWYRPGLGGRREYCRGARWPLELISEPGCGTALLVLPVDLDPIDAEDQEAEWRVRQG